MNDKLTYRITYRIFGGYHNSDSIEYKTKIETNPGEPFDKVIRKIARTHEVAACLIIPIKVSLVEKKVTK